MEQEESAGAGWSRWRGPDRPAHETAEPGSSEELQPERMTTFISAGASFEGTLSLRGDFRIDAEFRGELETDGTITVGPQGAVIGDIRAREIVISGAVMGNVTAARQLVIESTGRLHGDIETACLEIRKHAFFRGRTHMTRPLEDHQSQEDYGQEARPGSAAYL